MQYAKNVEMGLSEKEDGILTRLKSMDNNMCVLADRLTELELALSDILYPEDKQEVKAGIAHCLTQSTSPIGVTLANMGAQLLMQEQRIRDLIDRLDI